MCSIFTFSVTSCSASILSCRFRCDHCSGTTHLVLLVDENECGEKNEFDPHDQRQELKRIRVERLKPHRPQGTQNNPRDKEDDLSNNEAEASEEAGNAGTQSSSPGLLSDQLLLKLCNRLDVSLGRCGDGGLSWHGSPFEFGLQAIVGFANVSGGRKGQACWHSSAPRPSISSNSSDRRASAQSSENRIARHFNWDRMTSTARRFAKYCRCDRQRQSDDPNPSSGTCAPVARSSIRDRWHSPCFAPLANHTATSRVSARK